MALTPTPHSRVRAARLPPEQRKAQLIASALRVFARNGIGHTNHSMIAAEARVSLSAVFVYFPTHEQLTEAVMDNVSRFLIDEIIKPALAKQDDARGGLERMLLAFEESIDQHPDIASIWLDWSTAVRSAMWLRYLAFHRHACAMVRKAVCAGQREGSLRPEVNATDAAHVIVGLGHMIAHMKFAGAPQARIHRVVRSLIAGYVGVRMAPSAKGKGT